MGLQLDFKIFNNTVEYEALIAGLRLAKILGAEYLDIIGDSQLNLRKTLETYRCNKEHLKTYKDYARYLLD